MEFIITPSSTTHPLYEAVAQACKTVYDPEIPVNIFDLGLIYTILLHNDNGAEISMSLTSPACPVAGEMPDWVKEAVAAVPGITSVKVSLTFDPPWGIEMMTDEAKLELGFM